MTASLQDVPPADRRPAPRASELLARARELHARFDALAARNEAAGKLSDETLGTLKENGFFQMMIPACLGGSEAGGVETIAIVEELCRADASTGWVLMATQVCTAMAAAYLGDNGIATAFRNGTPIIAGQGSANGKAEIVPGGYRLTGKWSYGSGTLHADYFHSGALVWENGAPRVPPGRRDPESLTFVVPRENVVLGGNWDVIGLRATGSVDYSVTDAFVPTELTHRHDSTDPLRGGGFYSIGIIGMTTIGHTGFALGVARRALDELAAYARALAPRRGPLPPLGATDTYHEGFGNAEAQYRAARALVYETWGGIDATLARGEKISTRQITLTRLALNHVTRVAAEVCDFAYRTGGGYALRAGILQRCFRDAHAGTQHFLTTPAVLRECGRELAGLAPGKVWTLLGLADPR